MPASRWTLCLAKILEHEGGYADHPSDPGGATSMGITRKTLARWRGIAPWWALEKSEVVALGRTEAAAIYKALYWERCKAGSLPAGLDLAVFDYAVNSGPDRAVRVLQALVGTAPDGFVGPLTLAAVSERDPRVLIDALCDQRIGFLQRLSSWASFGRGWTRRVSDIRAASLAATALQPPSQTTKDIEEMNVFDGHKTYIIGALMLLVGIAQSVGFGIPMFGEYSGPQMIMEALAVIFLRRGLKADLGKV
ncbi:glycoside hydrolase family 108 protein [Pelagibacterium sp.]|uniref:glycoside hydrolase family 108 protein n=1 Tax=Pelagibacterium sp. TaxID=1967288 RepID=UPI003A954AB4